MMEAMTMHFWLLSRLLRQSRPLLASAYLAFVLTVLTVLLKSAGFSPSFPPWLVCALACVLLLAQHYLALRLLLDAPLLARLAQWQQAGHSDAQLAQLVDDSLLQLGLGVKNPGRGWQQRFAACLSLLKLQALLWLLQYLILTLAIYAAIS